MAHTNPVPAATSINVLLKDLSGHMSERGVEGASPNIPYTVNTVDMGWKGRRRGKGGRKKGREEGGREREREERGKDKR